MTEFRRSDCLIRAVDDDPDILDGLRFLLTANGWRIRTYGSAEAFLEEDDPTVPGCIILDIRMPALSGMELQECLVEQGSSLPVIFLTGHGDMNMAIHAFRNGAFDFLQKPIDPGELLAAIEKSLAKSVAEFERTAAESPEVLYAALTDRQKQVLEDVAHGLEGKLIAEHLGISPRTLQRHRQNVMNKLKLKSPEEAARFLERLGGSAG